VRRVPRVRRLAVRRRRGRLRGRVPRTRPAAGAHVRGGGRAALRRALRDHGRRRLAHTGGPRVDGHAHGTPRGGRRVRRRRSLDGRRRPRTPPRRPPRRRRGGLVLHEHAPGAPHGPPARRGDLRPGGLRAGTRPGRRAARPDLLPAGRAPLRLHVGGRLRGRHRLRRRRPGRRLPGHRAPLRL
ncbi:MAG: hypothetical protein AVDCRST_MAG54-400, partial [uncultured Actinomycetospora sp.]